ncbi:microsomal triglyceride transfer protein-like precursor [Gallus gallus]|uniref:Microsomal triglyceride transfer protein large subunit-like protein n=1 Tax=Gallus gallus TaxID=9031 RepID=F1NPK5_CHICK|nr:microsomal triglyceride transfer protein-like precursor [Gallus gallus]AMR71149.1 microsomal triglyceride transfer protein large subunit-like protein [Gallus gallus]|eukprot:NP_001309733.1 microsomal triglyceride transfer protein-like precursor [Gallus gallus]
MGQWALWGYICLLCCSFLSTAKGSPWVLSFQPGMLYQYHYALAMQLGPVAGLSPSGGWLQAQAVVRIRQLHRDPSGDELLQVQIQDLKAQQKPEGPEGPPMDIALNEEVQSELQKPVFISWSSGKIKALHGDETEGTLITNLKRGVVSLLQLQPHASTIVEEDASGSCQVTYTVSNHSIVKTKDLLSCTKPKMGYASPNKMFGIQWQPSSRSLYVVKDSLLQSVLAEESHMLSLVLRSTTGVKISSRQELKLVSSTPSPAVAAEESLENVLASIEGQHQPLAIASLPFRRGCTHCPSLTAYLKTFDSQQAKMDISKAATTWQFQRFIQMLRSAKKRDVLQLLKRAPEKMLPFVVEAAVAAQSVPALAALSDFLDFSKEPGSLLETFLYAAAFSPRPTKELLRLVLDKLDGKQMAPEVRDTGMVALGSLVGKLCQQQLCGLQEVKHGMETILTGLRSAEKEHEAVIHLLALGNAQLPSTIPTLLEHAEKGPTAVAAAAISALRQFRAWHITSEVKRAMRRIFHEKRKSYEKTCRLAAAEILLDNTPLSMDVINILLAAHHLGTEAATFLLLKVQSSLHANHHPARKIMSDIMRDPRINNYNHFSKAGISSSFSGPLTATKELLSTFGLDLLFLEGGFLRKSVSDFSLLSQDWHLRAAQVTIEAQGMESMLGENTLEGEEGPELTAGMSAIFFDVQLRPIIFFKGYTDLMAKVLLSSGEPTSVVKGNLLLMDHHQVIPLQSGLQAVVKLQGGLGLDISANVDVNIWEQELKTSVDTRGSLTIDFQAELDTPFLHTTLRSQTEAETSIYFDTILRFSSSPVLMCLQLREDQVPYREVFTISTSAGNQSSTIRKGRQGTVPAQEFALHQANSEMCHLLLTAEEGA